jgi:hypothetical protein
MTPAEFEAFCADRLRVCGWEVRLTPMGRDQGVDVIADKNGLRIVLQCKLYSNPVGDLLGRNLGSLSAAESFPKNLAPGHLIAGGLQVGFGVLHRHGRQMPEGDHVARHQLGSLSLRLMSSLRFW